LNKWLSMVAWLVIAGGLINLYVLHGNTDQLAYRGTSALRWMISRWELAGEDMSHAWLIPLVSLWALWHRRASLLRGRYSMDKRGLFIVVMALLMYSAGLRAQQTLMVLASFIMLLWGLPFYAFGWQMAKQLAFPCAYLVFCIPFTFLNDLTLPLRLISTSVSSTILNGMGISVTRLGTALHVNAGGGFSLDVAHPCSGLRYLVAMIALTTAYAYFTQRGAVRRVTLSLLSIPLAMIGNIVRIVLIAVVGVWFGAEMAVGFYHDYSGYVVFGVSTLLMIWIGGKLQRGSRIPDCAGGEAGPVEDVPGGVPGKATGSHALWVVALLLTVVSLLIPVMSRVQVAAETTADVNLLLPETFGEWQGEDLYYCQSDQCARSYRAGELGDKMKLKCPACDGRLDQMALGERTLLPADTRISRKLYENAGGSKIVATIVLTGADRRSIHRPQYCLPAQGFSIEKSAVLAMTSPGLKAHKMTFLYARPNQRLEGERTKWTVLAYWFVGGGHSTHDHLQRELWMMWDTIILGRRSRWAYVSLQTTDSESFKHGERLLSDFGKIFYPEIQRRDLPQ
jgi:exosortase